MAVDPQPSQYSAYTHPVTLHPVDNAEVTISEVEVGSVATVESWAMVQVPAFSGVFG